MNGPGEEEWKELSRQRSTCKGPAVGLGRQVQGTQKRASMAATQIVEQCGIGVEEMAR